ncbi:MAG TPA: ATP-binding protein [Candidatus Paceibacterota bacterium]|nr:ATP-binding protein [Candidatus Paceibacterota bacterium]
MTTLNNIDLLSVAVTVAAITILGFVAFFNDRTSVTNKSFLFLSVAASLWSIVNYLSYQFSSPAVILWLFRFVLFFAVWYTFALFQFFYVFPGKTMDWPRWYARILVPAVILVDLFTLTPFTFKGIQTIGAAGQAPVAQPGFGIAIFGMLIVSLVISAFVLLLKKLLRAEKTERAAYALVLAGATITFLCHIVFNYILPAFFNITRFLELGAVFIFPLAGLTAYAIIRHHLLRVKVFAAEAMTFVLAIVTFAEVTVSKGTAVIIFQTVVFVLVLVFGILLIQSVQREVEQREELEHLNKKIEASNAQLAELGRFKSELLSLASHQIRSPLAAMKGFITLVIGGSYGEVSDKAKEALGKVQQSADELIGLINTLLDVRKVEEGKMEYSFEKADLVPIVAGTVDSIMPLAETKKLSLTAALPPSPVTVSIDKEKFKQVVQNLIDNAIKYTPAGFVKVELKAEQGKASIVVSDSGYGIPAALIPFLFEEFIRDERIKKEVRGTGLGLYIARKIVEAHGGTLVAESPGEGKGSTFRATIPLAQ